MKRFLTLAAVFAAGVVSASLGAKSVKQFLNFPGEHPGGYTHVVASPPGRTVWLSGMGGKGDDGHMPADFRTQADNTFKAMARGLKMAGADFKDVVKINYFISDMKYTSELREVRAKYLNLDAPPAATLVQAGLSGSVLVEIECVAVVPESE